MVGKAAEEEGVREAGSLLKGSRKAGCKNGPFRAGTVGTRGKIYHPLRGRRVL